MTDSSDVLIIKWYLDYARANDWSQAEMARKVGRTKGWASLLANGKICRLHFATRNRIKSILGISQ